jgi:hypothetical protein
MVRGSISVSGVACLAAIEGYRVRRLTACGTGRATLTVSRSRIRGWARGHTPWSPPRPSRAWTSNMAHHSCCRRIAAPWWNPHQLGIPFTQLPLRRVAQAATRQLPRHQIWWSAESRGHLLHIINGKRGVSFMRFLTLGTATLAPLLAFDIGIRAVGSKPPAWRQRASPAV